MCKFKSITQLQTPSLDSDWSGFTQARKRTVGSTYNSTSPVQLSDIRHFFFVLSLGNW